MRRWVDGQRVTKVGYTALLDRIQADMVAAMKAKDGARLSVTVEELSMRD